MIINMATKKIDKETFELSQKAVYDDTKIPNEIEMHSGVSLTRVIRDLNGKKKVIGNIKLSTKVGGGGGKAPYLNAI